MFFPASESRLFAADPHFRATHHGIWRRDFQPSPVFMVDGSMCIKFLQADLHSHALVDAGICADIRFVAIV
jgi:hypothetical protein